MGVAMSNIPKDITAGPFYNTEQIGCIKVVAGAIVIVVVELVNAAVVEVKVIVCTYCLLVN